MTIYKVLILPEGRCINCGEAELSNSNPSLAMAIQANEYAIDFIVDKMVVGRGRSHLESNNKYHNRTHKMLLTKRAELGAKELEDAKFISRKKAEKGIKHFRTTPKGSKYQPCEFEFIPQE